MSMVNFPRSALVWLLLSVFIVYLPLQFQLPLWTMSVFVCVVVWRWMMHLGRWPYPTKVIKIVVVVLGISAVLISAQGRFHLESASSFVLVASLLKVLEIKTQRDGFIIIFLCFFLLAVNFLYQQGIIITLYSVLAVWVLMSALVGLHQNTASEQSAQSKVTTAAKTSVKILLLSLPIMLVLFVLFPRMGPLWSLNLQSNQAKTGLSQQMSPGDIAKLSNSDELVFRVIFDGPAPAQEQWYWRALVLDQYHLKEGKALWRTSSAPSGSSVDIDWYPNAWQPELQPGVFDYNIIQEATDMKWLLGLRGVAAMENGIGMTADDRIESRQKLYQRKAYRVRSWPSMAIAKQGLRPWTRQQNLQLEQDADNTSNPKSRDLAQYILNNNASDEARVAALLSYYQQQSFSYTLNPEVMERNDIDDFLFNKKSGFCAHYASSFVFVMRSMGIPARVVAGYQGGEVNKETGHITVRQYDAHAWVEVWLNGIGWRSVDPTAQIAPDRIRLGLREALTDQGEFLRDQGLSLIKLSHWPLLNDLRIQLDELNYHWHQTVLNFNKNNQASLLKEWFGTNFFKKSLYWLAGLFCTFFFLLTLLVLWQKPKSRKSRMQRALIKFEQKLSAHALERKAHEGLTDYSIRLQQAVPQQAQSIKVLLQQLEYYYYAKPNMAEKALASQLLQLADNISSQVNHASDKNSLRQSR